MIKLFDFDPNMLKLEKNNKVINIYYIGYVTKKEECKINSVNPLYLPIYKLDDFIEEKGGNKYLNIAFTDKNDEVLKRYKEALSEIKGRIEKINKKNLENMKKII